MSVFSKRLITIDKKDLPGSAEKLKDQMMLVQREAEDEFRKLNKQITELRAQLSALEDKTGG